MGRILLFGATGYTGRLVARELVRNGAAPVLVGRSGDAVRTLVEDLEPLAPGGRSATFELAELSRPASLRRLVRAPDDVLISTIGPYTRVGAVALDAAVGAGCGYVDCSAEPAFVRHVFDDYDSRARRSGARLLTGMGNESVAGNLAASILLDRAPGVTRLDVGYFATGPFGPSSGSVASAAAVMLDPSFVLRRRKLVAERPGASVRSFPVGDTSLSGISIAGTEALTLPRRYPGLQQVTVYVGWAGRWSKLTSAAGALASNAFVVPGVSSAVGAVVRTALGGASSEGPAEHVRTRSRSVVVAEGFNADGSLLGRVRVEGPNPYDLTGRLLAWSAQLLSRGAVTGVGTLGPVDMIGADALLAGCLALGLGEVD